MHTTIWEAIAPVSPMTVPLLFGAVAIPLAYLIDRRKVRKLPKPERVPVDIVQDNGCVIKGFAVEPPHLGGWQIHESHNTLDPVFGVDGKFPNGNPWRWVRWAFVPKPTP